jgi:orotidine-5'-phosphate decarboxylase
MTKLALALDVQTAQEMLTLIEQTQESVDVYKVSALRR